MDIQLSCHVPMTAAVKRRITRSLEKALDGLGCHDKELSVVLTDDDRMAQLNWQYRRKEGPTNVLAFPMQNLEGEPWNPMLGDVVVSVETARREAAGSGESLEERLQWLLLHGLLHLLGYDHELSPAEDARMRGAQEALQRLLREETKGIAKTDAGESGEQ